jgi:hypothetical protein
MASPLWVVEPTELQGGFPDQTDSEWILIWATQKRQIEIFCKKSLKFYFDGLSSLGEIIRPVGFGTPCMPLRQAVQSLPNRLSSIRAVATRRVILAF